MIENIQKYRGVLIVAFIVAAAAFVFGDYSRGARSMAGGVPVLKINGTQYTNLQVEKDGNSSYKLAAGLAQAGDFSIYQFVMAMAGNANSEKQMLDNFFTGRMLIREAKEQYGIYPSEQKISEYIKSLKAFNDKDGKFDSEAYSDFVRQGMGRFGLTENDLRSLVSDILVTDALKKIVGSGLAVDPARIAATYALDNQQVTAELARLELAPFKEKINPTDDEIKAYWETIKDSFVTEPKRKFTYVIATPQAATLPAEEAIPALPETATAEEKDAAKKSQDAARAKRDAAVAEAAHLEQRKVDALVDDFVFNLGEQKGNGFEELAKKNGWEIKTTELFPASAAPKELDVALRSSVSSGKATDSLFDITVTSDPSSKISGAIAIGENQWLVARLDGDEKSRPKTFEEAHDEAKVQYIAEKASEALKAAATEAATKIKAALATGKNFGEAAAEAGIPKVAPLPKITRTYRPAKGEPQSLFPAVRTLDPGSITEPILEGETAFIIFVSKREVAKEKDAETRIASEVASSTAANENLAFAAWIAARTEAANIQQVQH